MAAQRETGVAPMSLASILAGLASPEARPGAGATAALTGAMAASIVAGLARRMRRDWEGAVVVAARGDELAERLVVLADRTAEAYADALEALHEPGTGASALGDRLAVAAEMPLLACEAASQVAALASEVAVRGDVQVQGDALAAALIAEAASKAAASLVETNLSVAAEDPRRSRAGAAAHDASVAAGTARSALGV